MAWHLLARVEGALNFFVNYYSSLASFKAEVEGRKGKR